MTPYAILLVKPTDSDEVIRKTYHKQAELHHSDKNGGLACTQWYVFSAAYTAIKTSEKRNEWVRKQELHARICESCSGFGVRGTRMFKGKITVCGDCKGEGMA